MPDETEIPVDEVREKVDEVHRELFHRPQAGDGHGTAEEHEAHWLRYVGVSTALLAVLAAIGALYSGLLVNEALIQKNEQIGLLTQASDRWDYYQAEGLKSLIYRTAAQGLPPASPAARDDAAQARHYLGKQAALQAEAQQLTTDSEARGRASSHFLDKHHIFAYCVSLCQIAIALSAIAALTRRPHLWYAGLGAGIAGLGFLLYGFLSR